MREHKLKTWESAFLAVRSGAKKAEFRRNDRDFAVGDIVVLERFRPGYHSYSLGDGGAYLNRYGMSATGGPSDIDTIRVRITDVRQGAFGIPEGYCMFSFEVTDAE